MAKVTYITTSGESITVENASGNLMEIAKSKQVPGIYGICGGACSCTTCHVLVDPAWQAKVGPATENEVARLTAKDALQPASRLSCQIEMTDELDGVVVHVVEE